MKRDQDKIEEEGKYDKMADVVFFSFLPLCNLCI